MHFAIVDIETTGGSPKNSKITEIAVYVHNGKEIINEFVSLVNPEMKIPEFITRLTGISDQMVENAPKFYEIAKDIIEITEDCVFVAHNVGFDYGILRNEYKTLGYDFRRHHLCTVRASRYIIPGMASYSLGKLTAQLGISIKGRHRAGGDALATAQLFTLLFEKDPSHLETFIQKEVNPKILHPNLDLEILEDLPLKAGVYKFFNEFNQLIYIGKSNQIKKRVEQHLRNNQTKKAIQMRSEISRIEYILTGSELIALLLESDLIKKHQPIYNRSLRKNRFPFGLFDYTDDNGYKRLFIGKIQGTNQIPLTSFGTKAEGVKFLENRCEELELCQKLCDLYSTQKACFHHSIKKCKGACVQEEPHSSYNERVDKLIESLLLSEQSFYILDKGRHRSEKSLVLIERGMYVGYGYAPYHFNSMPTYRWKHFIEIHEENKDTRTILNAYLRKHSDLNCISC
jgi:DNA polymerase-3 subunit epsilon